MDPKFKANGVLANTVDYFCLVCESRFYNEVDAVTHISNPVHTKNFELTNYFENKDDYIRKIKKWYFCELCNLLLSTATKVRLHITELNHVIYKNERLLERNEKFVVAFSNIQIHDKAWNGIIEETCVICNTEFDDEKIHTHETSHIIKLIQSKTEFDANKNIYRKIDDSSIQCLTCNVVYGLSSIDTHFNQPEHIRLYQEAISSVQDKTSLINKKTKEENLNDKQNKELGKQITGPVTQTTIGKKNVDEVKDAKHENVNDKQNTDLEKEVESPITETNTIKKDVAHFDGKKDTQHDNVNNKQNRELEKEIENPVTETNSIKKDVAHLVGQKDAIDDNVNDKENADLEKEVKSPVTETIISNKNERDVAEKKEVKLDNIDNIQNTDLKIEIKSPITDTNTIKKDVAHLDGKKVTQHDYLNKKQNTQLEKEVESPVTETNSIKKDVAHLDEQKDAIHNNVNNKQNTDLEKEVKSPITEINTIKKDVAHLDEQKDAIYDNVNNKQNTDLEKEVKSPITEANIIKKDVAHLDEQKDAIYDNVNNKQNTDLEKEVKSPITETNTIKKDVAHLDGQKDAIYDNVNNKQNTDLEKEVKSHITETNTIKKDVAHLDEQKDSIHDNVNNKQNTDLEKEVKSPITETNTIKKYVAHLDEQKDSIHDNVNNKQNTDLEKEVKSPITETNTIKKYVAHLDEQKDATHDNVNNKQNTDLEKEVKSPVTETNISNKNETDVAGKKEVKLDNTNNIQNTDLEKEVESPVPETNSIKKDLAHLDGKKDIQHDNVNNNQNTDLDKEVKSPVTETNIRNKNEIDVDGKKEVKLDNINNKQHTDSEKDVTSTETNISNKNVTNVSVTKDAKIDDLNNKQSTDLEKEVKNPDTITNVAKENVTSVRGKKDAKLDNVNNKQNTDLEKEVKNPDIVTNVGKENVTSVVGKKDTKLDNVNNKQNTDLVKVVKPVTQTNISPKIVENIDGECHKKYAKPVKKSDKEICELLNAKNYVTNQLSNKLWCILCQWEIDPANVKLHTSDIHHQTLLKLHKKRLSRLNAAQITSLGSNNRNGQANNTHIQIYKESVSILDSIENFHQNGIQINFEIHTASCVKCSTSLKFDKAFIENHIKEHIKTLKAKDIIIKDKNTKEQNTKERESILDCIENFQKNHIIINFEIRTAFCKKCSSSLDFKKSSIQNHIWEHKLDDKIKQPVSTIKGNDEEGIMESADYFQNNEININVEHKTAFCKKCLILLDFNKTFIENHIKEHIKKKSNLSSHVTSGNEYRKNKNTINKKSSVFTALATKKKIQTKEYTTYTEEDIKKIAEENDMVHTPNSKEVHCNKCNTKIPSFPKNLYEHIAGNAHKTNMVVKQDPATDKNKLILSETVNKINHKKLSIDTFITTFVTIKGPYSKDLVLNNRICVNYFSFVFVNRAGNKLICKICNVSENISQYELHICTLKHAAVFNDSLVVVDGDEFIREVQSKGFHCGYCNIFVSTWQNMQNHLQSYVHKDGKTAGQWRLQQYLPHIQKQYIVDRELFEISMLLHGSKGD